MTVLLQRYFGFWTRTESRTLSVEREALLEETSETHFLKCLPSVMCMYCTCARKSRRVTPPGIGKEQNEDGIDRRRDGESLEVDGRK